MIIYGVPHPDFGEAIVAVVVPVDFFSGPSADDVVAFAKDRLANFKVPKYVHVAGALPRNTVGKVQKKALRGKVRELV